MPANLDSITKKMHDSFFSIDDVRTLFDAVRKRLKPRNERLKQNKAIIVNHSIAAAITEIQRKLENALFSTKLKYIKQLLKPDTNRFVCSHGLWTFVPREASEATEVVELIGWVQVYEPLIYLGNIQHLGIAV